MKKTINTESIQGRLYDTTKLSLKTVQNKESQYYNQEFISGSMDIATDEDCLNIVTVRFTFVQPVYKSGKVNSTFEVLKRIIEKGTTVISDGMEAATMVKVSGSINLNDFYTNRNGEEILVSAKENAGSFVNIVNKLDENEKNRSTFECDMLINGTKYVEATEENNVDEDYLIVKGAIFDFRNRILPIDFVVKNKGGINYFESLDASPKNMVFTKVWGQINSTTIVDRRVTESAFGEPAVKKYPRPVKEWIITGTSKQELVYEIGDAERGITEEEIKSALADREVYLAEVKKRAEEYQSSKNNVAAPAAAETITEGSFNF
jgi:hypothetical protein